MYRAIVARLIQFLFFFFFFHGRGKRGAKTKARTSYTACSNDSKKLAVWKRVSVRSSKTTLVRESIVGIEKRVGSIKRGVGGRRREEAVARG